MPVRVTPDAMVPVVLLQIGSVVLVPDGIHIRQCDSALAVNVEAVIPVTIKLVETGSGYSYAAHGAGEVVLQPCPVVFIAIGLNIVQRDGTLAIHVQTVAIVAAENTGASDGVGGEGHSRGCDCGAC